jgi:phosphoglycolate phosphatase
MSDSPEARVYLQGGFRWDEQRAYLWDIDGTLVRHRDRIHYDAFFESVRSVLGRELVLDGVRMAGNTDPGILRDAFAQAAVEDEAWRPHRDAVFGAMCAAVTRRRHELLPTVMPGVEAVLEHLQRKGALQGVATGNLEEIGWLKVENAGLRSWFSFGGFCDHFEARRDMIAHAKDQARAMLQAESQGSESAGICVIGDTPWDIDAARDNGLPAIAVATGNYTYDELIEHRPEVCCSTLRALLEATAGLEFHGVEATAKEYAS